MAENQVSCGKMWLVVSAIAALISTKAWIDKPGKNYYAQLSMGLWALTAMIFVDHVIGWFLEGAEGDFLEIGLEPCILSLCMLIPILAVWELFVVIDRLELRKNANTNEEVDKEISEEVA